MSSTSPPQRQHDLERLAGFESTLRAMARDQAVPLGNDATSAARHHSHSQALAAALARLADGTYGSCVWCGQPIPIERLEVVPAAPGCRTCTGQQL